ncbi:MAG TPA: maleylpyruvate isomerase family mycothiol-dependent enzyme [Acidimicrobiales bacterium]|nr:maleylpyruvate isomerase family mycothiol-dependent enzyme [Acidimicrobiales bacterium]
MKTDVVWSHIHTERAEMAETLAGLSEEAWSTPSLCAGWSVRETAGHILAAAEQTPANFYKELIAARFRFNVFTDRAARRLGALEPATLVARLRARTTTTNHPPAPVMAMLGEIVVHGEDIRRPLGLVHKVPEEALVAVADSYRKSNLLLGAKRRIAGLGLRASDADWTTGDGPEVSGPLASLVLAMVGRKVALADLTGEGVATLGARA